MSDFLTEGSRVDDLYRIDLLLKKNNMNRDSFYRALKLLGVTDRKIEYKIFNFLLNTPQYKIEELSQEIVNVKKRSKSEPTPFNK
jgi:hypothetical protein